MANTIVSLFDNASDAQKLVGELKGAGFSNTNTITSSSDKNVTKTLTTSSVPEDAARFYAEGVQRGGSLVTLDVKDNDIDRAMAIIERHNPVDINERATQLRSSGFTNFSLDRTAGAENETAIPVIEEQINIGKRQVDRGGIRVYSRVTERPVEETVQLREEHINVERRPVNRAVSEADAAASMREGTIEMTATSEEAVVSKQARVVEEVLVSKDATERTETVRDTVRRTDVEVEKTGTDDPSRSKRATNK